MAKGAFAAEWWPKIENYEKGALFRVKPSGRGPSLMPTIKLVISNISFPKAECQELDELHTTARLKMPLGEGEEGHPRVRFPRRGGGGDSRGRANSAKSLSCRIDPLTSLVHRGWHGKGRKKKTEPRNARVRALNR